MAFVRTTTFVVPAARKSEIEPGHNLYLAAVHGVKIVAQNTSGFHRGGVWASQLENGDLKIMIYMQFYDLPDVQNYANTPMVRDFESQLDELLSPPIIEIYETLSLSLRE